MIKFRLHEDINNASFPCGTKFHFQREIDYIGESQILGVIGTIVGGNMTCEQISVGQKLGDNPASILILRAGGAGDILFLTPVLRALRRRFPAAYIGVAISGRYHWCLRGNKNIDGFCDMPMKYGLVSRYDWVIDLEDVIETCHDRHAIDIFADRVDVQLTVLNDRLTAYNPEFKADAFEKECPKTTKRVGIQLAATTAVRTYPRVMELQTKLRAAGWEVAILAEPGKLTLREPIANLINIGAFGWSWSKATDFLQTCDFVIGPDSSMIHFAGAMGIPGIGIYGSFDARFRLIEGGSIHAIQAQGECPIAPCFHHGRRGEIMPYGGPCNTSRLCNNLATVAPDSILEKMAAMGF